MTFSLFDIKFNANYDKQPNKKKKIAQLVQHANMVQKECQTTNKIEGLKDRRRIINPK